MQNLYDKATVYKALESMPAEQLSALRCFFANIANLSDGPLDHMTEQEYNECLSIIRNRRDCDWVNLEDID